MTDEELKVCERFKEIRLCLNLKQGDFANEIKLTQGHVSDIENKRKGVSDRVIEIICLKYGICEEWLRYGTGEMKVCLAGEDRFARNVGKIQRTDNETIIRWVNAIAETNPEVLQDIEAFMKKALGIEE